VLHNIGIAWGDEDSFGPLPPVSQVPQADDEFVIEENDAKPAVIREAGQQLRDHLLMNMQPSRCR
jgi:hypothetical protein